MPLQPAPEMFCADAHIRRASSSTVRRRGAVHGRGHEADRSARGGAAAWCCTWPWPRGGSVGPWRGGGVVLYMAVATRGEAATVEWAARPAASAAPAAWAARRRRWSGRRGRRPRRRRRHGRRGGDGGVGGAAPSLLPAPRIARGRAARHNKRVEFRRSCRRRGSPGAARPATTNASSSVALAGAADRPGPVAPSVPAAPAARWAGVGNAGIGAGGAIGTGGTGGAVGRRR